MSECSNLRVVITGPAVKHRPDLVDGCAGLGPPLNIGPPLCQLPRCLIGCDPLDSPIRHRRSRQYAGAVTQASVEINMTLTSYHPLLGG